VVTKLWTPPPYIPVIKALTRVMGRLLLAAFNNGDGRTMMVTMGRMTTLGRGVEDDSLLR
jgi:hypothetical protein